MKKVTTTFEEFDSKLNEGLHAKIKKAMKAVDKGETVTAVNIRFPGRFKILKIDGGFATVDYQDGTEPFDMAAQNIDVKSIAFESVVTEKYDGTASDFRYELNMAIENELGISPVAIKKVAKKGKGFEVRMSSYMSNPDTWKKLGDAIGAELTSFKKGSINIGIYEKLVNEAKVKVLKDKWPYVEFKIDGKKHKVDFEYGDEIDDHGNEGKDLYYRGEDEDGNFFEVDVYADSRGEVQDVLYDTLTKVDESKLSEANKDGTISDDEDERRDMLEVEIYKRTEELINYMKEEAQEIGGPFRSPGIINDCLKQVSDAFKKNKLKLR